MTTPPFVEQECSGGGGIEGFDAMSHRDAYAQRGACEKLRRDALPFRSDDDCAAFLYRASNKAISPVADAAMI